jgi:hypothetical protein
VPAVGVAAHDVDRPDRGGVLAADQPVAVAEQVQLLGQQLLQVGLEPVPDQPGSAPSSTEVSDRVSVIVIVSVSPALLVTVHLSGCSVSRQGGDIQFSGL